ncbi:nitroreductase [Alcaligenaceae bacterium]|nr:nitroreductase [Alcaligenaceae bacterium]
MSPYPPWISALNDLLVSRHSCRAFQSTSVPTATIKDILNSAQRTATWCNTQPWLSYVTSSTATDRFRRALYEHAMVLPESAPDIPWPREYRGVYLKRRRDAGYTLYRSLGIGREDAKARQRQLLENYRFFGAPHVLLVTTDKALGPYAYLDCGGYVSNFLLAARAHGVDSCAQAAIAHHAPFVRHYLKIPDEQTIVCGISFGYADTTHPANSFRLDRADLAEAVRWIDQ